MFFPKISYLLFAIKQKLEIQSRLHCYLFINPKQVSKVVRKVTDVLGIDC